MSILSGGASAQSQAPGSDKRAGAAPGKSASTHYDASRLEVEPTTVDFGSVASGATVPVQLTLRNTGHAPLQILRARFLLGASGNSSAFTVTLGGKDYVGGAGDVFRAINPPLLIPEGGEAPVTLSFNPTEEQLDTFTLRFESNTRTADVAVSGLGGHVGDPFLHVVIDGPRWRVDYDGDGSEALLLDGTGSHTHEPGRSLQAYEWRVEGQLASTTTALSTVLTQPETEVELKIFDDGAPQRSLSGFLGVLLVPPSNVPGVLASYYNASATGPIALLDAAPPFADYVEQRPLLEVNGTGTVGGSPFSSKVLVILRASITVETSGSYSFTSTGGSGRRLFVDTVSASQPLSLDAGLHEVEARFAVDSLADLPLSVQWSHAGGGGAIPFELLTHDENGVVPVIHSMTSSGALAGGDPVTITGFGFFPAQEVVVHWGEMDLIAADFTSLTPSTITFPSPAGGGAVAVSVETGNGESNTKTFVYVLSGPPPVQFRRDLIVTVPSPTAGVWAPDGKFYVASLDGRITALEFDPDYNLVSQTQYSGVSSLSNHETLSVAINPYDPPTPLKLYVGHGDHFVSGGQTPTGPVPYTGQISVLTAPNFNQPVPLVTGLPVSNHDHAINGIAFDNNGDLLISVGSMTNAGIKAFNSGDLPESPFSAAIVKALLSRPGFNGAITYVDSTTGLPDNDERSGESVEVAPGVDVELHASGLRNAFGMVFTTKSRLYCTDNGPNIGFGLASTGPSSQAPDPYDDDELNLIERGNYYGSPNRGRGRSDARQNVYFASLQGPPSSPDTFFQMISWLPPSSDGIDEYRADAFDGQMRGSLIVQEYQNKLRRVSLKANGRGTLGQNVIDPNTLGLGCLTGPGGVILSLDYQGNEVEVFEPNDLSQSELVAYDIFPWRAPATGGVPFVVSGRGFGSLATTGVTIGGHAAALTEVTWGRIRGVLPAEVSPTTALLDVVVTVGGVSDTLPAAFRFLPGAGLEPGRWETLTDVGAALGEVSAGVINGTMYLVGEGVSTTYAYDLQNRQWLSNKATRSFVGHHHAAEVVGGKLYLVGGIGGGSEGRLQIYDPVLNSWSSGASLPWSGGSVSTAVIGGKIYAAGGIVSTFTVTNTAVYDPATNTWTAKANMPDSGRNHAAAGTDGTKLYVIGGRRGGNFVANGFNSLMIYNPATDQWSWSGEQGSTLAPLPEARGGMGKAVWFRNELYVFGGETLNDPDANANGVYDRVDVYNPASNTWRLEARMPNPRHGIFPVLFQGHVFLAGGGTFSANSQSKIFDTFTRQ